MYTKPRLKQILHLLIPTRRDVPPILVVFRMFNVLKERRYPFIQRHLLQLRRRLDSLLAGMDEHHDLVSLLDELRHLVKDDAVHVLGLTLRSRLTLDTEEVLFERDRTERGVKEEETLISVDAEEVGDVDIVGKGSGKTDDTDKGLTGLDLTQGAGDDGLDDGSSLFVEKMYLVDDEKSYFLPDQLYPRLR